MKRVALTVSLLLFTVPAQAAPPHRCAPAALEQARKLVSFHLGQDDDRVEVPQEVAVLSPVKNPVGKDRFDVLEVWAHVYKGKYRMRFLYAQRIKDQCLLMGQEVLEAARL